MRKRKLKLPRKIRTRWLKDLRSGKFKQIQGALYGVETKGFCCLGVLQHQVLKGQVECTHEGQRPVPEGLPTDAFWRSLGIDSSLHHNNLVIESLAELNDSGHDFNTIADEIEELTTGV